MRNTRPIALLVVFAVLALVAGCGGGSDDSSGDTLSVDDYGQQVSDEFASFNTDFTQLGQQAASPDSKDAYLSTVSQLQDRVGQTVDKLQGLAVPDEAKDFNDSAIAALESLQTSFDPIKKAVESDDQAAVQKAATDLQAAAADFEAKFTALDKQAQDAGIPIDNLAAPSGG